MRIHSIEGFFILMFCFSMTGHTDATDASNEENFRQANENVSWKQVFHDPGTKKWEDHWTLDGEHARIKNTAEGMDFHAGDEFDNDAHHAVLWTRKSFSGDVRIEYEFTKLDQAKLGAVTILYILATGSGEGPYKKDIAEWAHLRKVPAMNIYFHHMNLLHISYASFNFKEKLTKDSQDYIRARRYMPSKKKGLAGTDLKPDNNNTRLFEYGVPHQITVIKRGQDLFMQVRNKSRSLLCHWKNTLDPVTEGRIGLRHMYTRAARYRDLRVSVPESKTPAAQDTAPEK